MYDVGWDKGMAQTKRNAPKKMPQNRFGFFFVLAIFRSPARLLYIITLTHCFQ